MSAGKKPIHYMAFPVETGIDVSKIIQEFLCFSNFFDFSAFPIFCFLFAF